VPPSFGLTPQYILKSELTQQQILQFEELETNLQDQQMTLNVASLWIKTKSIRYIGPIMANDEKTELQREILLTWYQNPGATNKEIAEACDCSSSYVSTVKNRFDNYNEFEAMMDRQDKQMEQMFGEGIFQQDQAVTTGQTDQPGLAQQWEEIPNNAPGLIIKAVVLVALLYAVYQFGLTLI